MVCLGLFVLFIGLWVFYSNNFNGADDVLVTVQVLSQILFPSQKLFLHSSSNMHKDMSITVIHWRCLSVDVQACSDAFDVWPYVYFQLLHLSTGCFLKLARNSLVAAIPRFPRISPQGLVKVVLASIGVRKLVISPKLGQLSAKFSQLTVLVSASIALIRGVRSSGLLLWLES